MYCSPLSWSLARKTIAESDTQKTRSNPPNRVKVLSIFTSSMPKASHANSPTTTATGHHRPSMK